MKAATIALAVVALSLIGRPVVAQAPDNEEQPALALRPFVMATGEAFTAKETFKAAFGQATQLFYGGGLELVSREGFYLDVAASRFKKTGQRAFRANGQSFPLGLPLLVTITPVELTAGYRLAVSKRVVPYFGVGGGSYRYEETSDFSDPGENIDTRRAGFLATGGVELRAARWVGVGADVQYTHVNGILGQGGISKEAGEHDLGGVAVRLRVTVGR